MRTTAKYLTLVSVLIIFSLTLAAQKNLTLKDMQPLMAFASDIKYDVEVSAELNLNSQQFLMEEKLVLENWMVQPFSGDRTRLSEILDEEKDPPLKLYDWMICCTDWKIGHL